MRIQRIQPTQAQPVEKETNGAPDLSLIDAVLEKHKGKKGNLIPLLQAVQNLYNYIPVQAFDIIAEATGMNKSDMYGVATFYTQFRLKPVGKHIIKVCDGTACHVQGAEQLTTSLEDALKVKDGETTDDGLFTLETVACLGCCSLAPVMMIGEETYGKLDGKKAVKVIREIKRQERLGKK